MRVVLFAIVIVPLQLLVAGGPHVPPPLSESVPLVTFTTPVLFRAGPKNAWPGLLLETSVP
jgi:hypothetical protein